MGKQFTILNGFTDVILPSSTSTQHPYSSGQTATLTDAEYAALPASITRAINTASVTTVPDPNRTGTDLVADKYTVNATATGAISVNVGVNALTLTGAVSAVTVNGAAAGTASEVYLFLTQDATGSRLVTWGSKFKFVGGAAPTLSTVAGKTDIVQFITFDGGNTLYEVGRFLDVR